MEVTTEVKKQYRSCDAWFAQIGNVFAHFYGRQERGYSSQRCSLASSASVQSFPQIGCREMRLSLGSLQFRCNYFSRSFRFCSANVWPALSPEKRLSCGG